jgi:hypothetical protein
MPCALPLPPSPDFSLLCCDSHKIKQRMQRPQVSKPTGQATLQLAPRRRQLTSGVPDPPRISRFAFQISTNIPGRTDAEGEWTPNTMRVMEGLRDAYGEAVQRDDFWPRILKFVNKRGGQHSYNTHVLEIWSQGNASIEVGSLLKGSRVHLHALWFVKHRSAVQVDREALKSIIEETDAYKSNGSMHGLYVHIEGAGSDLDAQDYKEKEQFRARMKIFSEKTTRPSQDTQ